MSAGFEEDGIRHAGSSRVRFFFDNGIAVGKAWYPSFARVTLGICCTLPGCSKCGCSETAIAFGQQGIWICLYWCEHGASRSIPDVYDEELQGSYQGIRFSQEHMRPQLFSELSMTTQMIDSSHVMSTRRLCFLWIRPTTYVYLWNFQILLSIDSSNDFRSPTLFGNLVLPTPLSTY